MMRLGVWMHTRFNHVRWHLLVNPLGDAFAFGLPHVRLKRCVLSSFDVPHFSLLPVIPACNDANIHGVGRSWICTSSRAVAPGPARRLAAGAAGLLGCSRRQAATIQGEEVDVVVEVVSQHPAAISRAGNARDIVVPVERIAHCWGVHRHDLQTVAQSDAYQHLALLTCMSAVCLARQLNNVTHCIAEVGSRHLDKAQLEPQPARSSLEPDWPLVKSRSRILWILGGGVTVKEFRSRSSYQL